MQKYLCAFLLCAAVALCQVDGADREGYNVKFMLFGELHKDGFIPMHKTAAAAKENGFVQPEETKGDSKLMTYCLPNDPRTCSLYCADGTIAGHQIAYNKTTVDKLAIQGMDYARQGYEEQVLFGQTLYTIRQMFVTQETIDNGGRNFNGVVVETLRLPIGPGKEFVVPLEESGMEGTIFNKTNCFPKMGQHWFYAIDENLSREDFRPYFVLFDAGKLIGYGVITFAGCTDSKDQWYEAVPASALAAIAPSAPKWVFEMAREPGICSQHVYFTDKPQDISCPKKLKMAWDIAKGPAIAAWNRFF